MIANLLTPVTHNDKALAGISRSRFSFHFNTARKRRWLLVQLVTAPALTISDQSGQRDHYVAPQSEQLDYSHLLESYQFSRMTSRCF